MAKFLVKRLLTGLAVMWGIVTLLFWLFNLRGSPAASMTDENTDAATRKAIERAHHLDRPLFEQYLWYLNDLSPIGWSDRADGNLLWGWFSDSDDRAFGFKSPWLRRSFQKDQRVDQLIGEMLPGTALLGAAALLIAISLGIPLGMASAMWRGKWLDQTIAILTQLGVSAPSFLVGVILIRLFAVEWGDWTGLRVSGFFREEEVFGEGYTYHWRNLFLPAMALGIRPLAIITQLTRGSLADVLSSDYIRTARAKGLAEHTVVVRHGLKNALNPVLTSVSGWFASLLAGAFFVETVFDWQGLGKLTIDALNANDYPVILGTTLFVGSLFVATNIIVDFLYTRLDPRIQIQ
jgi:peptide/nickel transport system permease protein